MKKRKYAEYLDQQIPETPLSFREAMNKTLVQIQIEGEAEMKQSAYDTKPTKPVFSFRRKFVVVFCIISLIAVAAVAAGNWSTFKFLGDRTGIDPKNADEVMRSNLHHESVNGVEITVQEAGYDGKALYLQYSFHLPDVDHPIGTFDKSADMFLLDDEEYSLLSEKYHVGWWIDHLWIDGKCVDMPSSSTSITTGSENNGEIIQTEYWRLDNENIQLKGQVAISLPIGQIQPLDEYSMKEHPEKYDESGNLMLPEKGIVTFTLDTSDMLSKVHQEHPQSELKLENASVSVAEVYYSPLSTYIKLAYEVSEDAIKAYKEQNGEGYYNEEGKMLWEYGGMEIIGEWVSSLTLVDEKGSEVFPGHNGLEMYGPTDAEFVYPYISDDSGSLYLAPMIDGQLDTQNKIKIK